MGAPADRMLSRWQRDGRRVLATPAVVALTTLPAPSGGRAVIRIASGRVVPALPDECRFTTEEMLATERRVIVGCSRRNVEARQMATGPREVITTAADGSEWVTRRPEHIPGEIVEGALRSRPSLSDEQRAMVRRLTTSHDAVLMVRGHAGTGTGAVYQAMSYHYAVFQKIWNNLPARVTAGQTGIDPSLSSSAQTIDHCLHTVQQWAVIAPPRRHQLRHQRGVNDRRPLRDARERVHRPDQSSHQTAVGGGPQFRRKRLDDHWRRT